MKHLNHRPDAASVRTVGVAAALLLWLTTAGAQITLNGNLLTDAEKPVPDTKVSVAAGPSNTTDSKGQFSIKLSWDFIEGERVFLVVHKEGWVINSPLDGEWNLPAKKLQEVPTQYTKVIIVPKGSKALWTHARIEKHVALLSDEIAKLKKEGDTPKPVDFSYYLSEWADKYGFTPAQVKAAFDQWANAVKDSTDKRTKGLREFYQSNFVLAAQYFDEAAAEMKELEEARRQKVLEIYQNRKDAGNSLSTVYQFAEALIQYEKASALVSKESFPQEWAEIRIFIGNNKKEIGIRTESDQANLFLKESEQAFREAFEVYTREQLPQDWAMTQNNLGTVYGSLGTRTGGEEGAKFLRASVTAYENALVVYTREQLPQDWAGTQNNLGIVYRDLGTRTGGEEGAKFLRASVTAYENALVVFTREQLPQPWATTQNNLGNVYQNLGTRTGGEEGAKLLRASVTAFENALEVFTREQLPQPWATTQNNLGNVLSDLGTRTGGEEGAKLLRASVTAFENALEVNTREQLPQDWAMTQNNLGNVYWSFGTRTGGEEGAKFLRASVTAFKASLEIRSFEYLPVDWAQSQNNLAETYEHLEDWTNVAACHANVLKVYPDYDEAYQTASYLYHEVLFNFPEAFTLDQNWLARHGDDLSAQCTFAEKHFTTGRFAECEQRLAELLANEEIEPALRAIRIANALAQNKTQQVPAELEILQQNIAIQPDTFKVNWSFNGTKHFISTEPKLAPHREWLLQFFAAMEREDGKEAILAGLREMRQKSR